MGTFFLFVVIVAFVYMIVDLIFPDQRVFILERLNSFQYYNATQRDRDMKGSLIERIYKMSERFVLKYFEEQVKKGGKLASLEVKLLQADMASVEPLQHRAKKFIFAFSGAFLFILVLGNFGIGVVATLIGFFLPDVLLNKKIEQRQYNIKNEIPDFMDLLAAVFPASKGLEDAIEKVCSKTEGVLSKEFEKTLSQIKNGRGKRQAFGDFSKRCGIKEVDTLVSQILQSETFGTGLQDTLTNQAKKLRSMKKVIAEIKAQKAKVNLLLPGLFLLTTILIVIIGPSAVQFLDAMGTF